MLAACCNCTPSSPAFITQGAFFVNSVSGNDANDGLTAATALRTLAELARRFEGHVVSPGLATITVQLTGTFPTEFLTLDFTFGGPTTMTVKGTMTLFDSGTVTANAAWNGAAAGADGTRGSITDAAQDFTGSVLKRIRMTSGANIGALSHVASLGAGITIANTGQFTSTAIATVNPANGENYAVETYDTTIAGWSIHAEGPGTVRVEDLQVVAVASPAGRSGGQVSNNPLGLVFFGCHFDGTVSLQISNKQRFASCSFIGGLVTTSFGQTNFLNCCMFDFLQLNNVNSLIQACLFEGGGARDAGLLAGNGSYVEVIGGSGNFGTAHYGVINGTITELLRIEDQGQVIYSTAAANMIGATGNAVTNAVRIRNGSFMSYVTKPKAEEAPAGVANVVLASAAAIAWAAVPAAAAAPNVAALNVRQ